MAIENFSHYGSHAVIFDFVINKKSGSIAFHPGTRKLFFEEGNLIFASSEQPGEHFTDILVTMEVLDSETLEELRAGTPQGESLGRKLKELGLATPNQLAMALKQQISTVVDTVFALEEGSLEVQEGPLTARVPKLKIQILPLVIRTFANIEDEELLAEVSQGQIALASNNFAETLATTPLPGQYQNLVELLERGMQATAATFAEELEWEPRMVESALYVMHLLGAVQLREPREHQGELFAAVGAAGISLADEDELDATALDGENPLDLSIQDHHEEDEDATLVEGLPAHQDSEAGEDLGWDQPTGENPVADDLDQPSEEAPTDFQIEEDQPTERLADSDDLLAASLDDIDAANEASFQIKEDMGELELDDEGDLPVTGPKTDLLAAALDDTLDEEEPEPEASEQAIWDQLNEPITEDAQEPVFDDEPLAADAFAASLDDEPADEPLMDDEQADDDLGLDALDDAAFGNDEVEDPFAEDQVSTDPFAEDQASADPFADDEESDDPFAEDQASADPFAEEEESADPFAEEEDELGLDAMDQAARELEQEGFDFEEPESQFGGASDELGHFDADDAPNFTGEFSADDLEAAMPDAAFEQALSEEKDIPASYVPHAFTPAEPKSYQPDPQPEMPSKAREDVIMPSRDGSEEEHEPSAPPKHRSALPALVAVLVLAAAGYGWYAFLGPGAKKSPAQTATSEQAAPEPAQTEATPEAEPSEDAPITDEGVADTAVTPAQETPAQETPAAEPPAAKDPAPEPNQAAKNEPPKQTAKTEQPKQTAPVETKTEAKTPSYSGGLSTYMDDSMQRFKAQAKPYTVALLLACERDTVDEFMQANSNQEVYIFPKKFKGRSCYALCWGSFKTAEEASAARDNMPSSLKTDGTWVINNKQYL